MEVAVDYGVVWNKVMKLEGEKIDGQTTEWNSEITYLGEAFPRCRNEKPPQY